MAVRASTSSSSGSGVSSSSGSGRSGGNSGGNSGSKAGGPRPGGKNYKPKPRPAAAPRPPASSTAATASTSPPRPVPTASSASDGKQAWVSDRPEPKTARERVSFKNKVPFSDDMYATLKRAIELLSERVRTDPPGQPLSKEDAAWLSTAVEAIIADAKKFGPPSRPERSASSPASD